MNQLIAERKKNGFETNLADNDTWKFSSEEMKTIEKLDVSTYFNEIVGVTVKIIQ